MQDGMVDGNLRHTDVMAQFAVCSASVHCGLSTYQSARSAGMMTWPMGSDVNDTPITLSTPAPSWNGSFGC
jgi:hypothetical protein